MSSPHPDEEPRPQDAPTEPTRPVPATPEQRATPSTHEQSAGDQSVGGQPGDGQPGGAQPATQHTEPLPRSPYLPFDTLGGHGQAPGPTGWGATPQPDGTAHQTYAQQHLSTPPPTRRRGPGWGGAIALALAAALVAGGLGGVVGGVTADVAGGGPTIVQRDGDTAQRPDGSVASIAADAVPSVVTVQVRAAGGGGTGSGWVYDDSGHIVTNNHVVEGAGSGGSVSIELSDGSRRDAKVVGKDSSYDLAVLEVDPKGLEPLAIGRSSEVVVGDEVVAVGSPLGLGSTVTAGIVSALERPVTAGEAGDESFISAIQTDAAINPGNSGGPLLNGDGDVVGVNSAIAQIPGQQQASGSIGVGFAIPSDVVVRTVDQLIATGTAEHPIIGVSLDRRWDGEGAKVLEDSDVDSGRAVVPGGPADKAGVEPGDVITELDGRRITGPDQLITRIRAKAVGDKVTLTIQRDGKQQDLSMTLEAAEEK